MAKHVEQNTPGLTTLGNLVNPIVLGAYLDQKLIDAIKLSPLMEVNRDLQGHYGDTLQMQKYSYIGDATPLAEGEAMEPVQIGAETISVTVGKCAKAVEISDEAIMNHYGNVVDEIGKQLLTAIAGKIEADAFAELRKATVTSTAAAFNKDAIVDAQIKFGEDINEQQYLLVSPKNYAELRRDDAFVYVANGAEVISGYVGKIFGADVIVSNRVQDNEAYLMKPGALMLLVKQNCVCEADRDILKMTNVFTAHEFYVPYLKYEDRIVKITIG